MTHTDTKASALKAGDTIEMGWPANPMRWTVVANNKSNNRRLPVAITFLTEKGYELTITYGYTTKFWVENN